MSTLQKLLRKAANDLSRYTEVLENDAQSRDFYRKLNNQGTFISKVRTLVLPTKNKEFPVMDAGEGQLLFPGEEAVPLTHNQQYTPVPSKVILRSSMFRGRTMITRELLEENLAGQGLTAIIRSTTRERLAQETEDINLLGVGPTGGVGYANDISSAQKLQEGWIERMRSVHIYNMNDAAFTEARYFEMLNQMPSQHAQSGLSTFMNWKARLALQQDLSNRMTDKGDVHSEMNSLKPITVAGIPTFVVPRVPDQWGTQNPDKTIAWMCNPKKAMLGYFRRPDFEIVRDPLSGTWYLAISMRMGNEWIDTDGTVFASNVGLLANTGP